MSAPGLGADPELAHYHRLRPLAWEGFAFTLPARWEVTGYDLGDTRRGILRFHCGSRACGELSWRATKGTPDLPLIIADAITRAEDQPQADPALARPRIQAVGEWQLGRIDEQGVRAAALWQASRGRILLFVFTACEDGASEDEIATLLSSFEPNAGELRRWRIFGVGCALPPPFRYERVEALPADTSLHLESDRLLRLTLRRIGLVSANVAAAGGLDRFYAGVISRSGYRLLDLAPGAWEGRAAVRADFERVGMNGLDKLMGSWWRGQGWMWHDPLEDRIYAWEQCGPPKAGRLEMRDAWE